MDKKTFDYFLSGDSEIDFVIQKFDINIAGILHIGAHECQELDTYSQYVSPENILWVEASLPAYKKSKENPHINIINELVSDVNGQRKSFNIFNNTKLNSELTLVDSKEIAKGHRVVDTHELTSKTLKSIYTEYGIPSDRYNFLALDTQGTELSVLKGMGTLLTNFKALFIEVNEKQIYKGCNLLSDIDKYLFSNGFERPYIRLINNYGNALYVKS